MVLAAVIGAGPLRAEDFAAAATRIDGSSVGLSVDGGDGPPRTGAGFALRPGGLVATAAHVVRGADRLTARLPDGRTVAGEVIGADDLADVAVVRVAADLPPVVLGPTPRRGEAVAAIGDPLGFAGTLTVGHLSNPARRWSETNPYDLLQHDAALNPGSSGGALIDRTGAVVGMNVAIADGARRNVGIGLAVPAALVVRIADRLIRDGTVPRPTLGARVRDTAALRGAIPTLGGLGVMVEAVDPASPAAAAGLAPGQIVVAADGRPVHGVHDLAVAIEPKRPGDHLRLAAMVGDDVRIVDVALAGPPAAGAPTGAAERDGRPLGLDVAAGSPATIRAVAAGSVADGAGLAAGDEIVSIGLEHPDPERLERSLRAARDRDGVALLVRRGTLTRWVVLGRRGRLDGEAPFGSNAEAPTSHPL